MSGDLLGNFKKTDAGSAKNSEKPTNVPEFKVSRGDNMLDAAKSAQGSVDEQMNAAAQDEDSGLQEAKTQETKTDASLVKDPEDWSKESALKEVKKLRQENKSYREKFESKLHQLQQEAEARIKAREEELSALAEKAKKLEQLEAQEADRKRDLSEKLAHRESKIASLQSELEHLRAQDQQKILELESQIQRFRAEEEARIEVAKMTLQEEINSVPTKYRAQAELLAKGAGDPSDAITVLREAKISGLFEDKTVYVNHSVPNAQTGARTSKEQLDEAEKQRKAKMSSSQKIAEGLKKIRQGESNSVFRIR